MRVIGVVCGSGRLGDGSGGGLNGLVLKSNLEICLVPALSAEPDELIFGEMTEKHNVVGVSHHRAGLIVISSFADSCAFFEIKVIFTVTGGKIYIEKRIFRVGIGGDFSLSAVNSDPVVSAFSCAGVGELDVVLRCLGHSDRSGSEGGDQNRNRPC